MITERKKFLHSLVFPSFFLFILWTIKFVEVFLDTDFHKLGIYPLKPEGLVGIIFAPLIHSNINHLISNSVSLYVLMIGVFYFYSRVSYRVFIFSYIITGFWVWISARPAYHIGASGLIYAFGAFLITSGIIKKDKRLMALSFIVIFIYGSMIWGVFPGNPQISWESHLLGMFSGILLAVFYKNEPLPWVEKIKVFKFEQYYSNDFWNIPYNETDTTTNNAINYQITKKDEEKN
jgi:membrane associated rhomboid family serine protease